MTGRAWNRKGQPNQAVLEHARALLFALAVLIERAAGLPTARRLWFLAVMGRGEAEARRLIVAMTARRCPDSTMRAIASPSTATEASAPAFRASHPWPSTPAEATTGEPTVIGDAALLATRFRMLALAVEAMLAQVAAEPPCRHAFRSSGSANRNPRLTSQDTPAPAQRATSPPPRGR